MWLSDWGTQVSRDWVTLQQNPTDATKKKFDASLEVVKAIVGGVGTVATIGGGFFVFWNVQLTQTRLITERFSKAVEQLGSEKIEVRLGGIYALERIAQDSDRDHWTIMEVLTSFIKEKTSVKRLSKEKIRVKAYERWQQDEKGMSDQQNWNSAIRDLATELMTKDIQAALTVIGRRRHKKDPPDKRLNLSYIHLSCANLHRAFLQRASFYNVDFYAADLSNADFSNADLKSANFTNANLQGAELKNADLKSATFSNAILYDADLRGANLRGANLRASHLISANLYDADLSGANLKSASITPHQIKQAKNWQEAHYDADFRQELGLPPEKPHPFWHKRKN
jgi:uncharacterized protein YjbI with pentapeptide repeats